MNSCFLCSAPFKHFMKVQMCNRCPPSRFPISLHACSGSWGGGHYCILAERLDGSQFSGGASNEEEGRPGGDGCFFHLLHLRLWWLLAHLQTLCVFNQWTTQNRKQDTHKGRGIPGFYSLHLRVLETHTGHSGPVRVGGGVPGVKTWLENSFCVRERRKVLCVIRPPSLSDIFSRAGPSESPQNAGHFFWSMLS